MNLRHFLSLAPVVALLIAACADQTNPDGANPGGGNATDPEGTGTGEDSPDPDRPNDPGKVTNKQLCTVTKPGDAAKVIKATLLLPEEAVDGELLIDKNGMIACAAKSCSSAAGYASATKIECKNAVLSPGLINPHDHISFANNPPHKPTDERYEHRHDWRKGARQHTKIATGAKSVANAVDAAELRFVMSGVTAIAGAGGAAGLARTVDGSPAQLEAGL